MPGRVEGKVAIVTGAGSGIGAATARALHGEGAKVVLADITGAEEQVAGELGDGAIGHSCDVSDDAAVAALIARTVNEFGRLDVMCNNAGIDGEVAPLADSSLQNFDRVMAVNTRGVYAGTMYAIQAMSEAGGGSIINISSIASMVHFSGLSAYCASKAAVLGITRAAAAEYGMAGIRCNAICPGAVKTALLEGVEQKQPELISRVKAMTVLGRLAQPRELAAAVVFLASDESSFLTGAVIPVDGGSTAAA